MLTSPGKLLKNFISLSISEIITRGSNFIVFIFIARLFSVNEYGVINLVNAILTYFILGVNFGYDILGTRETAKDVNKSSIILNEILSQKIISSLASFIVYVIFALVFLPQSYQLLALLFGMLLFTNAFNLNWYYRGIEKMEVIFFARIIESSVYLLSVAALLYFYRSLYIIPVFFFLSQLAGGIFYFYRLPPGYKIAFSFRLSEFVSYLKKSAALGLTSFFALVYLNMDLIMISYIKGEYETGIYGAAVKLFVLATVPLHLISASFFPGLTRTGITGKFSVTSIKKYFVSIMTGSVFIFLFLYIFPVEIITIIYGKGYLASAEALIILSLNILFVGLSMSLGSPLVAWGRQNYLLIAIAAGAVINLTLNFILIPSYSYVGAAYATLLTEIVVFSNLSFFFYKVTKQ